MKTQVLSNLDTLKPHTSLHIAVVYGVLKGSDSATQNAWLGGTDAATEKTWTWEDGTTFSYTNWHTNFENVENQNCMQMRHAEGQWDDVSCDGSKEAYICKK